MIGALQRAAKGSAPLWEGVSFGVEMEEVGATQQEREEAFFGVRSILGVSLDPGEIVILVLRRSWLVDAVAGVLVGVAGAALVWAVGTAMGKPSPHTVQMMIGLILGAVHFVLEHIRRLYVLTDRRVIRQERGLMRLSHLETPLGRVRTIELVQNDLHRRLGAGSIIFGADEGAIVWSSVGEAKRVHTIATETVRRFGGSMRGM